MFTDTKSREHDLKIVDVPITFKKRRDITKTQAAKKICFKIWFGRLLRVKISSDALLDFRKSFPLDIVEIISWDN